MSARRNLTSKEKRMLGVGEKRRTSTPSATRAASPRYQSPRCAVCPRTTRVSCFNIIRKSGSYATYDARFVFFRGKARARDVREERSICGNEKKRDALFAFSSSRDQGLLDRCVSRKPRTTANGFGSRSTLAIAEPRFAILGLNFWLFFSPKSRRLRSRAPTSVTPAYGSYATPLSSACIPRVSRARSTRPLDLFRRGRRGRDPPRRRRNDASRKDKYLWFKPSVLTSLRRAGTYRPWLP